MVGSTLRPEPDEVTAGTLALEHMTRTHGVSPRTGR
jgi:hypothetical protein